MFTQNLLWTRVTAKPRSNACVLANDTMDKRRSHPCHLDDSQHHHAECQPVSKARALGPHTQQSGGSGRQGRRVGRVSHILRGRGHPICMLHLRELTTPQIGSILPNVYLKVKEKNLGLHVLSVT